MTSIVIGIVCFWVLGLTFSVGSRVRECRDDWSDFHWAEIPTLIFLWPTYIAYTYITDVKKSKGS